MNFHTKDFVVLTKHLKSATAAQSDCIRQYLLSTQTVLVQYLTVSLLSPLLHTSAISKMRNCLQISTTYVIMRPSKRDISKQLVSGDQRQL